MLFNPPEISRKKETDQIEQTGQKSKSSSTTYYGPATWISQSCSQCIVFSPVQNAKIIIIIITTLQEKRRISGKHLPPKFQCRRRLLLPRMLLLRRHFYPVTTTFFLCCSVFSLLHHRCILELLWLSLLKICLKVCLLNSSKK